MNEITEAIDRASRLLDEQRLPQIVYRRNNHVAVMSLKRYLDLELDDKGATRICVVTKNGMGKTI